jgi:hypothetical protein
MDNEYKLETPAYYDKKWAPLTDGLEGRASVYTAWVMENEAKYICSHENMLSGMTLKFVFPAIRRSIPDLINGDLNFKRIYQCLEESLYLCYLETFVSSDYEIPDYVPSAMNTTKLTLGLAERTKASIESLRNIL